MGGSHSKHRRHASEGWSKNAPPSGRYKSGKKKKYGSYDEDAHTWPWGPPPGPGYPLPQAPYLPPGFQPMNQQTMGQQPMPQAMPQQPWPAQPYYPYPTMAGYPQMPMQMPMQMQQMMQQPGQPMVYQPPAPAAQQQQPSDQRPLFAPFQPANGGAQPAPAGAAPAAPAAPPEPPTIAPPPSPPESDYDSESEPDHFVPQPSPMPSEPPPRSASVRPPSVQPPVVQPPTPHPPTPHPPTPHPPASSPTPAPASTSPPVVPPFVDGHPNPAWYGPSSATVPRTPLRNPLPEPPRDIYELEPYKSLTAQSFLSQLLTAGNRVPGVTAGATEAGMLAVPVTSAPTAIPIQVVTPSPGPSQRHEKKKSGGGFFSNLTRSGSKRRKEQKERERLIDEQAQQQRAKKRSEIPIAWRFIQPVAQGMVGVPPSVQAAQQHGAAGAVHGTFVPDGPPEPLVVAPGMPPPPVSVPFAGAGPGVPPAYQMRSPRQSSPLLSPLGVLPGTLSEAGGHRRGPSVAFSTLTYPHLSGFMLHSAHEVTYHGLTYPTALHLLEAHKFMRDDAPDGGPPELAALAERVRLCESVGEVLDFTAGALVWVRGDWDEVVLEKAEEVLYLKFRQHPELCGLLIGTADAELIYAEPNDPFWGGGESGGRNELGQAVMRVRERIFYEGPLAPGEED